MGRLAILYNMAEAKELQSNLANYKAQLGQVKASLLAFGSFM